LGVAQLGVAEHAPLDCSYHGFVGQTNNRIGGAAPSLDLDVGRMSPAGREPGCRRNVARMLTNGREHDNSLPS
jgi:hypothetical protein